MPRDYKQRSSHSKNKPASSGWPWLAFITGMLVGAAATVLLYLNEFIPVPLYVSPQKDAAAQKAVEKTPEPRPEKSESPKPRFEFYTLLPEMEVAVPDLDLAFDAPSPAAAPAGPGTYYLQAGSFRLPAEADKMKANLAFLGLESSIQTVTINGTDTWHRVRIGPFSDLATLNESRRRLKENKIDSIVLKVRG